MCRNLFLRNSSIWRQKMWHDKFTICGKEWMHDNCLIGGQYCHFVWPSLVARAVKRKLQNHQTAHLWIQPNNYIFVSSPGHRPVITILLAALSGFIWAVNISKHWIWTKKKRNSFFRTRNLLCSFNKNHQSCELWSHNFEMATFAGTTQKCKACEKKVYLVEQLTADNQVYHKSCFRCHHCKGTLKVCQPSSKLSSCYFDVDVDVYAVLCMIIFM